MNDLISRSAVIDRYYAEYEKQDICDGDEDRDWLKKCIEEAPAVDAVEVGNCDGCCWKEIGRQQKCSCCRRNRYLKDCYEGSV
jgi:hypothetical protein